MPAGQDLSGKCGFPRGADFAGTVRSRTPRQLAYVHLELGGVRIASVVASPAGMQTVLYYHRDRLGSVVATSTKGQQAGVCYVGDWFGRLALAVYEAGKFFTGLGEAESFYGPNSAATHNIIRQPTQS